ncbi:hypothetical protein DW920_14710 [Clostridium sp. AM42-36]|jgi:hypothetical protein|nr:hypothetical protein DW920_14710 [Clostridium sp. AM42-36]
MKDEFKKVLIEQGVWEREVDEVLDSFSDNISEDDLQISSIFNSTYDLGVYYVDNVVGTLDHHVSAVLDFAELGKEIADTDDEYLLLKDSGRIIEFKM